MALSEEETKRKNRESCRRYYIATKEKRREYKREYNRAFYQANRKVVLEKVRLYRENNREQILERNRKSTRRYYEANRDKILDRARQHYQATIEKQRERSRSYWLANREKLRDKSNAAKRRWYLANLDRERLLSKLNVSRRRAQQAGAQVAGLPGVTPEAWAVRIAIFGNVCAYCGADGPLQHDHVEPLSQGGYHTPSNIVPACRWCNLSKKDRPVEAWYRKQAFFDSHRWALIQKYTSCKPSEVIQLSLQLVAVDEEKRASWRSLSRKSKAMGASPTLVH